jgi:hypothetical protein
MKIFDMTCSTLQTDSLYDKETTRGLVSGMGASYNSSTDCCYSKLHPSIFNVLEIRILGV